MKVVELARPKEADADLLMLTTLTPQGVQTLKANPSRLREVNRDVEELGAKVLHQWATLGEYDFVNIVEAPDAATWLRSRSRSARAAARSCSRSSCSTSTHCSAGSTRSPAARTRCRCESRKSVGYFSP